MPQLDFLSYFSQMFYFYMFFVVLYFFLLVSFLPALVRNLKFRSKAIRRIESLNAQYALKLAQGSVFNSLISILKKLNKFATKSLSDFSVFVLFVNFYVLTSKQFVRLNGLLQDSFSGLLVKKDSFKSK